MAKKEKVTIEGSNLLDSLSQDWGGENESNEAQIIHEHTIPPGIEWGINRGEIERFIKSQFGTKCGS
ncbi:MAG: hypothetical protein J5733_03430, partial [Bacteroidaceae bacterium]|nr:hypothetical protein [Bacteroidaceae bacterium]